MKNVCRISVKSLCLVFVFALSSMQAQETKNLNSVIEDQAVKGIVFEEGDLPLEGVNVVLKGSKEGVVTNEKGEFEFPRKLKVDDILIFSYIGFNPQEYVVGADATKNSAITINFDLSNLSLMGAVEVDGVYESKRNIFQKFIGLFK